MFETFCFLMNKSAISPTRTLPEMPDFNDEIICLHLQIFQYCADCNWKKKSTKYTRRCQPLAWKIFICLWLNSFIQFKNFHSIINCHKWPILSSMRILFFCSKVTLSIFDYKQESVSDFCFCNILNVFIISLLQNIYSTKMKCDSIKTNFLVCIDI